MRLWTGWMSSTVLCMRVLRTREQRPRWRSEPTSWKWESDNELGVVMYRTTANDALDDEVKLVIELEIELGPELMEPGLAVWLPSKPELVIGNCKQAPCLPI